MREIRLLPSISTTPHHLPRYLEDNLLETRGYGDQDPRGLSSEKLSFSRNIMIGEKASLSVKRFVFVVEIKADTWKYAKVASRGS